MQTFQNLIVWQKSMDLVTHLYQATNVFPKHELFSLVNQMRRAAVSIPSNIAEGNQRQTRKENAQFLYISYGSCAELKTQLLLSKRLEYVREPEFGKLLNEITEVEKMLNAMLHH